MNLTNIELSILSLIVEQPRHGYEIEQTIEARGMRNWTEIGFSSIYYVLKKLESQGLIQSARAVVDGRGPARRVYQVTRAGEAAWRESSLTALSDPQPCYTPFQLGLASLPGLDPQAAQIALQQYRQRLGERRQGVAAQAEAQRPLPAHVEAMFSHSLALIDAELTWVENLISHFDDLRQELPHGKE